MTTNEKHAYKTMKLIENLKDYSMKVSRFEFMGVALEYNSWGDVVACLPIYRTHGKTGHFDYAPIHWSQPLILEGY